MRNVTLQILCVGAAMFGLLACNGETTTTTNTDPPVVAPDYPSNSGQAAKPDLAYPEGPWGYKVGTIIKNYKFIGFANASLVSDSMQAIELAQFYNPHADDATYAPATPEEDDRLFAAGSPYGAGTPKPKALLIDAAAVWCGPCNQEAKSVLPGKHTQYKPMGGEFLLLLTDGPSQGVPATSKNLFNWTKKYKVDFPSTIQPGLELGEVFSDNAFPTNMIIDTRTMKIVRVIAGVPDATFWTLFEKTVNGG